MKKINLYGPPNTLNFIEATRYFISRWDLTMSVTEWNESSSEPQNCFKDEFLKVVPILVVGEGENSQFSTGASKLQSDADFTAQDSQVSTKFGRAPKPASIIKFNEEPNEFGVTGTYTVQLKQDYSRSEDFECPAHGTTPGTVPPLRKVTRATDPLNAVVCYACHAADVPGKFDAKKADALGVPPKMRSILVKGQNLTLESGKVVTPSECIAPSTPGKIMLVVHCANLGILKSLVSHPAFAPYQRSGVYDQQTAVLIHMTPADLIDHPDYQAWMAKFPADVQHIIVNRDHCARPITFNSSASSQMRLNTLHPTIFQGMRETLTPSIPLPTIFDPQVASQMDVDTSSASIRKPLNIMPASPLLKFHLSPAASFGPDLSELPVQPSLEAVMAPFQEAVNSEYTKHRAELQAHLNAHSQKMVDIEKRRAAGELPANPYSVVFLGTGAALPSKYRNVSSTFVSIHSGNRVSSAAPNSQPLPHHAHGETFLLDAGEGTYGQLSRMYSTQAELDEVLRSLECIFISHMHADHHLGVMRLLLKRQEVLGPTAKPLLIIAPPHYQNWIQEYEQIEKLNYELYNAYDLAYTSSNNPSVSADAETAARKTQLLEILSQRMGLTEVSMVPVIHCPDAFGVTMKHEKLNWKMVFSGDTRPCALLDEAGADCDLLIHEATFEDQLTTEAIEKNHATTTEAIQSASNMKAKFLMMTHFSQRYPKIPVFDEKYTETTGIAFDLMTVTSDDLPILPKLLPCLKDLFDEIEEAEETGPTADPGTSSSAPPTKKSKK